ncbi:MAG: hypothetical protein ACRDQ5_12455, partial [Sciscionella sp.]
GSSIALAGAYMLAGELATKPDHTAAFAAYEHHTRDFVAMNQALVTEGNARLFPSTPEALSQRNTTLRSLSSLPDDAGRPEHSALTLPTFSNPTVEQTQPGHRRSTHPSDRPDTDLTRA